MHSGWELEAAYWWCETPDRVLTDEACDLIAECIADQGTGPSQVNIMTIIDHPEHFNFAVHPHTEC